MFFSNYVTKLMYSLIFFIIFHQSIYPGCDCFSEYVTSKEISKNIYSNKLLHSRRFGRKKGTIEQIVKKFPFKKNSIIITNGWSQEDYMMVSFIVFLFQRLNSAIKIFNLKKYDNWKFGKIPPLEELSVNALEFNELPEWEKWWRLQGETKKIMNQIRQIFESITDTPDTFRFPDQYLTSNKITKPFISLTYIFSREMLSDNAFLNNISKKNYKKKLIEELKVNNEIQENSSNHISKDRKIYLNNEDDPLSLFKRAYGHVRSVRKKRKFNSENGDSDVELIPNWWEKELDIVTAIILTIFKYQYKHRMKIIQAENQRKDGSINWKGIKKGIKQLFLFTSNQNIDDSLDHIPIWHRFGEKWQSFPQGAMIRILDNISRLSVKTSGWDVYDYTICMCFYYLLRREKLRIDWFTLGPLSGSSSTRIWRRLKRFLFKLFSSNKGLFDMKNNWFDTKSHIESE